MADGGPEDAPQAEIARLREALQRAERRIAELELRVDSDALTGLRNRHGFERELKRSLAYIARYGGRATLAYFDLDSFKAINDSHGHAAGDAVLRGVSDLLSANLRASDVVARIGGDEFAALMWNIDPAAAQAKAERLEACVAAASFDYVPPGAPPLTLRVGLSCGLAPLDPAADFSQVLDAADRAMYARKRMHRREGRSAAGAARA